MNEKVLQRRKISFYMMSLFLLFILIIILTINIPLYFGPDAEFIGIIPLLKMNILPTISLILGVISWMCAKRIEYEWKGVTNPPYKIKKIKDENYEYLVFLTTYIIPLVCIDFEKTRYVIVLGILLVLIGSIFLKMDLYYGNPTLALLGYRLYRVEIEGLLEEVILISKDKLESGVDIQWIIVGEHVWTAKKI